MARAKWTPTTPWVKSNKKTQAYWPPYVCRNRSCKSFGSSHPNCECGAPTNSNPSHVTSVNPNKKSWPSMPSREGYAHGGEVNFCESEMPHVEGCEHFASGGEIESNHEFMERPSLAIDHAIAHEGLLHALTKTGHSKSENLNRPNEELLDSARRGRKEIASHASSHFDSKHENPEVSADHVKALRDHLDEIEKNPELLLNTGGNLSLQDHAGALGAKAATVSSYLSSIKPKAQQAGPLDSVLPPDKMAESNYNRQLGIAEQPLSVLSHVKTGTIIPSDIQTLSTLYPELTKSLQEKLFSSMVDHKTSGKDIRYAHKFGLSHIFDSPLDYSMSQPGMAAIIKANVGSTVSEPIQGEPRGRSGATAETQKTFNKNAELYATKLDKIEMESR